MGKGIMFFCEVTGEKRYHDLGHVESQGGSQGHKSCLINATQLWHDVMARLVLSHVHLWNSCSEYILRIATGETANNTGFPLLQWSQCLYK